MNANQVVEESIRILLGSSREQMNKLNGPIPTGSTSMALKYPLGAIQEGAQLGIDNEMFRVWSSDESFLAADVEPGFLGSSSDSHDDGALVYVNPRFPRYAVLKAMNDELVSFTSPANGLYRMESTEFSYYGARTDYDLPAGVLDVYDVLQEDVGPSEFWPRVPNWSWNPSASSEFLDGASIHIPYAVPGRTIRVLYKTGFNEVQSADMYQDLIESALLPTEMHDILSLGVLMRLGPSREIKRNFTEAQSGDSRRADEVQAGSVTNSFAWVRNQRSSRLTEERLRLERLYPPRLPLR